MASANPRPDSSEIRDRHRAFWRRDPADRPLGTCFLGSRMPEDLYPAARRLPIGRVRPADLDVATFLPDYERRFETHASIGDDSFWADSPFFGIPWAEAIFGCPVYYSGESFWVEPIWEEYPTSEADWAALRAGGTAEGAEWLAKLNEFTGALVASAAGRFGVTTPLLRGPSDLAAAVRGHVPMVYDLHDHPADLGRLIDAATAAWIAIARAQLALIPPFEGGYLCHFYRAMAPDQLVLFQEDASSSFSPATFRAHLLPADNRIAAAFPYTVIHVHGTTLWPVDDLLTVDRLSCVEINYDDNAPRLPEVLPVLQRIQAAKPLIIRGALTADEVRYVKEKLSPRGLLLNLVAQSVAEARSLMGVLRE